MADQASAVKSPPASSSPPTNFRLKTNLTIAEFQQILDSLSRGNLANPTINGASVSTRYFENSDDFPEDNIQIDLNRDYALNPSKVVLNSTIAVNLIAALRDFFQNNRDYLDKIRRFPDDETEGVNYYSFIVSGISTAKNGTYSASYEAEKDSLNTSLKLLARITEILIKEDLPGSEPAESVSATIPPELQKLIGAPLSTSWNEVRELITFLNKFEIRGEPKRTYGSTEYGLADFRKFLNAWLKELFKTTNPEYKRYFDKFTEKQKEAFLLKEDSAAAIINPNQKNDDDAESLKKLAETFSKLINAILERNTDPDKVIAKVREEMDFEDETGGGSEAAEEIEDTQPEETQEEVEEELEDDISLDEAEQIAKEAVVAQVISLLNITDQLSPFTQNLNQGQTAQLQNLIQVEVEAQVLSRQNFRPILLDNLADLAGSTDNLFSREKIQEWLDANIQFLVFSIDGFEPSEAQGYQIIATAYRQVMRVSEDFTKEDITPAAVPANRLDELVAEYQQYLGEDISDFDSFSAFSGNKDQLTAFLQAGGLLDINERRLENVFLAYLQNQGLEGLTSLDELSFSDRQLVRREIQSFLLSLSPAEILQLRDPSFIPLLAARFNRKLLLGRFDQTGLYANLQKYVDQKLTARQDRANAELNQVLGKYGVSEYDLGSPSPEEIDGLSIEEFNRAFGVFIPPDTTPTKFALLKTQYLEQWRVQNAQADVIKKLMLLYGDNSKFIYSLDTADKINLIFGMSLPEGISAADLGIIQQKLVSFWETEIAKQANKRNYHLNKNVSAAQGRDQIDIENTEALRDYLQKLETKRLGPGLLSQMSDEDFEGLKDEKVLGQHKKYMVQVAPLSNFELYQLTLKPDETQQFGSLSERWQLAVLLQQQQLAQLNAAQQQALQNASILDLISAQIEAEAYQAEAIRQEGIRARIAQTLGIQKSKEQQVQAVLARTQKAAIANGGSLPQAASGLAQLADAVKSNRKKYAAAGLLGAGAVTAALRSIQTFISNGFSLAGGLTGAATGAYIGAQAGTLFLPVGGTVIGGAIGGLVGFAAGSNAGNWAYNQIFGSGSAGSTAVTTTATTQVGSGSGGAGLLSSPAAMATAAAGGTMVVVNLATQNALDLAFLQDELDIPVSYVEITKTAQPNATVNPTEVTYTITITPEDGYTITLIEASDSIRINYNQDTNPAGPNVPPTSESFDAFNAQLQELVGQPLTESFTATYTVPFNEAFFDASITNTIEVTYDAASAEETLANQSDSASARVCFGDCPNEDGCFIFVDPGDSIYSSTATTRFSGAGVTAKAWQEDEKAAVLSAFSTRAGTSENFYNLICRPNGESTDREVKLYRLIGSTYGGWAFSNDEIAIYDLGMSFGPGLEYTLIHELGHIVDYRNAEVGSGSFPGYNGDCPPTYPATCNPGEPFAEALVLYVIHKTYSFSVNYSGVYSDFPTDRPAQYNYIRDNIFPDVSF